MDDFDQFLRDYACLSDELTTDDLFFFLNEHYNKKFNFELKNLLPSQILTYPRNILIDFEQWNQITNEVVATKIKNLFKLCRDWFISIIIKDVQIGKEIKNILDKEYIIKDRDCGIYLIPKKYKYNFLEKVFWPKSYSPYRWKYYINDFLDIHFDKLLKNIVLWVDFNMQAYDTFMFSLYTFEFIKNLQDSDKKVSQSLNLYNELKARLWDSVNYWWDIVLSYPLRDYIENKWYYFEILDSLYLKEKINYKEIFIEKMYITFVIERIVNFDKRDFIPDAPEKSSNNTRLRSSFDSKKWTLMVLGKEFPITKKTKIHDLFSIIYAIYDSAWETNISLEQIWKEYIDNKYKYKFIESKDLNYERMRDILKNRLNKIKLELEVKNEIIGIKTSWLMLNY